MSGTGLERDVRRGTFRLYKEAERGGTGLTPIGRDTLGYIYYLYKNREGRYGGVTGGGITYTLGTIETPEGKRYLRVIYNYYGDLKRGPYNKEPPHFDLVSVYEIGYYDEKEKRFKTEYSATYKERKEAYSDTIFSVEEILKNHKTEIEKRRNLI